MDGWYKTVWKYIVFNFSYQNMIEIETTVLHIFISTVVTGCEDLVMKSRLPEHSPL